MRVNLNVQITSYMKNKSNVRFNLGSNHYGM